MKPYYSRYGIDLYQGDCEEVMSNSLLSAQVVITSPPYNMGTFDNNWMKKVAKPKGIGQGRDSYDEHEDGMSAQQYDEWQRRVLRALWERLPPDGAIYYNHRQRIEGDNLRLPLGMDFGIPLRQVITWDRNTGIETSTRYYCVVGEWVFLFAKPEFRLASLSASGRGDIWHLGMADKRKWKHPAPFPLALPQRVIETTAARSVMDPFAGSGTTLVAALQAGVPAVGIELSERYCEMIARRLDAEIGLGRLDLWRVKEADHG